MTVELTKRMLDACYQAKRIRDMLPPLPEGVMPSYIHYLDTIRSLEQAGVQEIMQSKQRALNDWLAASRG